jgi:hypothetical protein
MIRPCPAGRKSKETSAIARTSAVPESAIRRASRAVEEAILCRFATMRAEGCETTTAIAYVE